MALVDKTLSQIVDEISNPAAGDRLHIIRKIGDDWLSYFIEMGTIKDYSTGVQSTGVKQLGVIAGGDPEVEYIAVNAILQFIAVSDIVGVDLKLKVGITMGGEEVLPLTDDITEDKSLMVFYPCYVGSTLYINLSGTGSAKITLVFTENLF